MRWVVSPESIALGPSPDHIVVERETGRAFEGFLDLHDPEDKQREALFEAYEAGYRNVYYDLTISSVRDVAATAAPLIGMSFVVPDRDGDTVWTLRQWYTEADLVSVLRDVPVSFKISRLWFARNEGYRCPFR